MFKDIAPNDVSIGKKTGMVKNIIFTLLVFVIGKLITSNLLLKSESINKLMNKTSKIISKYIKVSGLLIFTKGKSQFVISPVKRLKTILNPTENIITSPIFKPLTLNNHRSNIPGIVKKNIERKKMLKYSKFNLLTTIRFATQ